VLREPDPTAKARLICLPISGMGATVFRRWPDRIDAVEICLVQLPGRENRMREAAIGDMGELSAALASALEPLLDVPYAFFGHCLGGRIAYATALACLDRGLPAPRQTFASSCLAPHHGGRFGPFRPEMTDEEFLAVLRQGCLDRGETPPDDELLRISLRVLRTDVGLSCDYVPSGPEGHSLSVTTIGWQDDADVRPDQMADWSGYGPLRHVVLPGDEHTFRTAPQELLNVLADGLHAPGGYAGTAPNSSEAIRV
jgi:surfactin synthase thioesterase subunit